MEEKKTFLKWITAHKTELIIAGATVVGTVLVIKNREAIKRLFKVEDSAVLSSMKIKPIVEKIIVPVIPREISENLTGNKLTARELGNKVWCSAQALNKRIVSAGLAVKQPCGEYTLTEAGRLVGESTWKVTRAGHSFSNIEWDEKILEIIFSIEELLEIANKQEIAQEILSKSAA